MGKYKTKITEYGYELINEALSGNGAIITDDWYIALGDGETEPSNKTTRLNNIVFDKNSDDYPGIIISQDKNGRYAEIILPESLHGYTITEIGLFDENDYLVAVANTKIDCTERTEEGFDIDYRARISLNAIDKDVAIQFQGGTFQILEEKGKAYGYAPLDNEAKVPLEHLPELNTGSGIPIGFIGQTIFPIDETKGLQRYLNGSNISINQNTQSFLNKLKEAALLYPSLIVSSLEEWETAKTLSLEGQCGKFFINEEEGYIKLPLVIKAQGCLNLTNIGNIVDAALPNIKTTKNTPLVARDATAETASWTTDGPFIYTANVPANLGGASGTWIHKGNFDLNTANPIYKDGAIVQEESIQYPYFIQIATGAEETANIVNEIELNNPFSLFDYKYSEQILNNASWLPSLGQWNSKTIYPTAYQRLLDIYNGVAPANGLVVDIEKVEEPFYTNITATKNVSSPLNAFDGKTNTYAIWGTATDYIEVSYSKPVTVTSYKALVEWQSGFHHHSNVDIYTVDDTGAETLIAAGKGAYEGTYWSTAPFSAPVTTKKLRFKLQNPRAGYPTLVAEIVIDIQRNSDDDNKNNNDDYKFLLNLEDETFRLPLKTHNTPLNNNIVPIGNGNKFHFFDGTNTISPWIYGYDGGSFLYGSGLSASSTQGLQVSPDSTKSGLKLTNYDSKNTILYYYVGETVQNANLINAGVILEQLANKLDTNLSNISNMGREVIASSIMPDYSAEIEITSKGFPYTVLEDGFIDVALYAIEGWATLLINGHKVGHAYSSSNTYYSMISGQYRVQKGDIISKTGNYQWAAFYPLKSKAEEN